MKKILMGLMAVSALSFAAIDLTQPSENIFASTKQGKIGVTGALTSTISEVKYVVFASTGNGSQIGDEKLVLPPFVLSQTQSENVFTDVAPKIYVKKVNGTAIEPLTNETVKFILKLDPAYTLTATGVSLTSKIILNGQLNIAPTAFISKTELQGAIDAYTDWGMSLIVSDSGEIVDSTNANKKYMTPNNIAVTQSAQGVLEFVPYPSKFSNPDKFDYSTARKVQKYFKTEKPFSPDVAILVEVSN